MSDKPIKGRCNHEKDDGTYCEKYPLKDDDGEPVNGKCYIHQPKEENEFAPNFKHGMHTDRSKYYRNVSGSEQAWIDQTLSELYEEAPFDPDNSLAKKEILRTVVIDMHKVRRANSYIDSEGMVEHKVVARDNEGEPIWDTVENTLNVATDRLERSIIKRLKDLGMLDDPESQKADNIKSLAEVFQEIDAES